MDPRLIATVPVLEKVVPALRESAATADSSDPRFEGLTDLERAQFVAGLTNALGELREKEKVRGVMSTPQNRIATLLQSLVVENATDAAAFPNTEMLEAKFDTHDWVGWAGTLWQIVKHAKKFPWKDAPLGAQQVAQFSKAAPRIAVFGDWGTGLYGAPVIRDSVVNDRDDVDMILHVGDVYYSGKADEFASRFTAMWPARVATLNRALNGNHEMYCGGQPYWNVITQAPFNQSCSYFAYQNDHWVIIGLDTAYEEHDLVAPQADWLKGVVAKAENRRVVLFSHHQPFSLLSSQGPELVEKLKPLLQAGRIFAWYWGHEHECVLYDKHAQWQMYGRCIGHAGMPEFRPGAMGPAVTTCQFRRFNGKNGVPACLILDGPNPYIRGEETKFTPHGYATLRFEPQRLVETIHDADGTALLTNELT